MLVARGVAVCVLMSIAPVVQQGTPASEPATIAAAQQLFFTGKYDAAAAMSLALRASSPDDLSLYELRTSALHFQVKRAMGDGEDRGRAFKACAGCPALVAEFMKEFHEGRQRAQAAVKTRESDIQARFLLGKIDLNYVWLQLGTLGKKTGWGEYWEARKSLDHVLQADPSHIRARVARAWVDYIVDTKVAWGLKWMLGGGSRRRGLDAVRAAAESPSADRFVQAEARFALWEMLVREKRYGEAVPVVRQLSQDFPGNQDIAKFLETHGTKRGQ